MLSTTPKQGLTIIFVFTEKCEGKRKTRIVDYLPQCEKLYNSSCFGSSTLLLFDSLVGSLSFVSFFNGPMVVTSLDFNDLVIIKKYLAL